LKLIAPIKGILSKEKKLTDFIKNVFGYYPGNILVYRLALCHRSAATEEIKGLKISNERLEYLGDAVLSAVIADYLFRKFPNKDEGFLTEIRSRIVSRDHLNKLAEKLGFGKFVVTASGNNVYRSMNGDAFEAFIGAVYLDKSYNFVKKVIVNRIIKFHIDMDEMLSRDQNYKSKLIEWAQREKKQVEFVVVEEEGSGYKKQYVVAVLVNQVNYGSGRDYAIKKAEQHAAEKALQYIAERNTL
jgi:ribonuclease III